MTTNAWAIVDANGIIDANTVHSHRRGAIVNWLHTKGGVKMLNWMSDEMIEDIWSNTCKECRVIPVYISEGQ